MQEYDIRDASTMDKTETVLILETRNEMVNELKRAGICLLFAVVGLLSGCEITHAQAASQDNQTGRSTDKQSIKQPASQSSKAVAAKLSQKHVEIPTQSNTKQRNQNDAQVKTTMNTEDSNKPEALLATTLEPMSAVSFNGESITASVISHGCTTSDNFIAEHQIVDNVCQVVVRRTKPDLCRRAPFVANITVQWSQPEACAELVLNIVNPMLVTAPDGNLMKRFK